MAQIVEANFFAVCPFQYLLEPLADIAWVDTTLPRTIFS